MAAGKEIRTKIKSIQNTQKITSAMEMVAASKMRKAQDRMKAARPYADKIRNVVAHLAMAHPEYRHPFMEDREVKRIGVILVSTDRGLCGGLNTNLFRLLTRQLMEWKNQGLECDLCCIGKKGAGFFKRFGVNIVSVVDNFGDAPEVSQLRGAVDVIVDRFTDGDIDRLYVACNEFVNTMTQKPRLVQLLPGLAEDAEDADEVPSRHPWDYIYEPNARVVLDQLLIRYLVSRVFCGVVENIACEMAARMIAMKSASDNAANLIDELQLIYNKARQASITQEISEIVGGAAALG